MNRKTFKQAVSYDVINSTSIDIIKYHDWTCDMYGKFDDIIKSN